MKLGSLVTGLATALVLAGAAATPAGAVPDQMGTVWNDREGDWDGVWTRRGTSNVFDAVWTQRYTLEKVTAVLIITVKGNTVSIQRRNGTEISYTGTIGGDGITVTGIAKVLPTGRTFRWEARIQGGIGTTAPPASPTAPVVKPPATPPGPATGGPRIQEFNDVCNDCGHKRVDLGTHDFCALTGFVIGGFNSRCIVGRSGPRWYLDITDPGPPDPWQGESQECAAMCFTFAR